MSFAPIVVQQGLGAAPKLTTTPHVPLLIVSTGVYQRAYEVSAPARGALLALRGVHPRCRCPPPPIGDPCILAFLRLDGIVD